VGETFCVCVDYGVVVFHARNFIQPVQQQRGAAKSLKLNCRHTQRVLLSSLFYGAKVSIYQPKFAKREGSKAELLLQMV